jgi:uncharacterized protein
MEQVNCPAEVIEHCKAVAMTAKRIAKAISSTTPVDLELVSIGALVHDIGRAKSHGIDHAVVGAKIAYRLGFSENVVNIIERHIGAGITKSEAARLGLPLKNYCPKNIEEKIVAHADNLTRGSQFQSIQECVENLKQKSVDEGVIRRIVHLHEELSLLCSEPL